jgi:hypothetical protein
VRERSLTSPGHIARVIAHLGGRKTRRGKRSRDQTETQRCLVHGNILAYGSQLEGREAWIRVGCEEFCNNQYRSLRHENMFRGMHCFARRNVGHDSDVDLVDGGYWTVDGEW